MFYQTIQYIKFLFKSTNQHGIHSPFVFDLVTKCFYDKKKYPEYKSIKEYKINLLKNKKTIIINDLGSGSKKTKTSKRRINEIVKTSGTTIKRSKLLFRLSKYFNSKHILELGTSLGMATHALSQGNPNTKTISIEGCSNISKFTKNQLKAFKNINIKTGDIKEVLQDLQNQSYDLIFFDGNHQKAPTLNYFETLLKTINNDSVFIFDDIYWSKGMTEAWNIIKQHSKVTVTIDTFYWGFVFFRKEQSKEHFTIRV